MEKIGINPQLQSKFSHLIYRYNLSNIVYLLDRYLEGITQVAREL